MHNTNSRKCGIYETTKRYAVFKNAVFFFYKIYDELFLYYDIA